MKKSSGAARKAHAASSKRPRPAPVEVPADQHLEYEMAAQRDTRVSDKLWHAALVHKRRLPRLPNRLVDPGPGVLEKLERGAAGALLDAKGRAKPVVRTRNPQPKGSFGFVGVAVRVEGDPEKSIDAQLVLAFEPKKLGSVDRQSLRLFRFDEKRKRFELVYRSAVGVDGDYVYGRIARPGRYVLIGINAHPLILSTIRVFCDLSHVIRAAPRVDAVLREQICLLILCPANGLAAQLGADPRLMENLARRGEQAGFDMPPGHEWPRDPGFAGDLCDRCLGMPGALPPECAILEPPSSPTLCNEGEWEIVGPRDLAGHLHRVIVDPDDPDRLFAAGFNCGIWALDSVDDYPARTWRPLTDQLDTLRFRCLKAAPSDGDVLYAGSLNGRLYRSDDHGNRWTRTSDIHLGTINELLVHHSNPDIVHVATSGGLRRSLNRGVDFSEPLYAGQVVDAVMDPADASILYIAVTGVGVLKSYLSGAPGSFELILPWSAVSNPMAGGIDAVHLHLDRGGACYFFIGDEYVRYDDSRGVEPGYPRAIAGAWSGWPAGFASGIDASVLSTAGDRYYAFKGSQYIRFLPGGVDPGYPRAIAGNWLGWPADFAAGIDAALLAADDSGYWFFKGSQCLRYTAGAGVDAGYPRDIGEEFGGLPADWDRIDAAMLRNDGNGYYLFRGSECARFDTDLAIRPGYPRPIADEFPGTHSPAIRIAVGVRHGDGTLQSDADRTVVAKFGNEVFVNREGGDPAAWQSRGKRGLLGYRTWCHCLAVDPFDGDVILAGQQQLFRSEDGGMSWDVVATYYRPHEDQHSVAFDPGRRSVVYLANDGGVFRSADNGRTWWTDAGVAAEIRAKRNLNRDLVTAEFYRVGVKGNRSLGNLYHSGIIGSRDLAGGSWRGAEGHAWEFNEVYADRARPRRYLVFAGNLVLAIWPPAPGERNNLKFGDFKPYNAGVVGCIAVDERPASNTILVGAHDDPDDEDVGYRLMRTVEGDVTPTFDESSGTFSNVPPWEAVIDNGADPVASVAFAPTEPGRAYAMSRNGQCFAKADVSAPGDWDMPGAWSPGAGRVRQIAVSAADAAELYAVTESRFARSETGGSSWTEVGTATLPVTEINSMVADPRDGQRVYIGADDGVYVSNDRGDTWSPFDDDLPNAQVTQIFREGHYLYAVTHGRGLWRTRIC